MKKLIALLLLAGFIVGCGGKPEMTKRDDIPPEVSKQLDTKIGKAKQRGK
jgi:hypothetical protein